jgi:hypothetical protein
MHFNSKQIINIDQFSLRTYRFTLIKMYFNYFNVFVNDELLSFRNRSK